jgi:hypothetical protein
MSANVQPDQIPERIVTNRGVAALFVFLSAWTLYLRVRRVSARFKVPEHFWVPRVFHEAAGLALDLLMYIGFVIVVLGLFGSTRDRVEKIGIVACFASVIIKPLPMLFPAYAAAVWWVDLGFVLAFLLASVAVLLRLSRSDCGSDGLIDPPAIT